MQLSWLWRGLRTGVLTTGYPARPDAMPAVWRGTAVLDASRCHPEGALPPCVRVCLPGALRPVGDDPDAPDGVSLDSAACIACGLCIVACGSGALTMSSNFELAGRTRAELVTAAREPGAGRTRHGDRNGVATGSGAAR